MYKFFYFFKISFSQLIFLVQPLKSEKKWTTIHIIELENKNEKNGPMRIGELDL